MFLSKDSRSGIYYVWYKNELGKRQRVSTRSRKKTEAIRFLQSFKSKDHERTQKAKRTLLTDYMNDFFQYANNCLSSGTVTLYKVALKNFLRLIGNLPLMAYTPLHFDTYKNERLKTIKPVTVNIELRTLKAFFNTAVRWNLIEKNPCQTKLVKVPERLPTYLTKEDLTKLISVIKENWLKEIIIFAVSTGLRRSEIVNLKWHQVDLERKLIRIESNPTFYTKTGKMRILPLNDTALYILHFKNSNSKQSEYVFSLNGKKIFANWITHLFKHYVKLSNINQDIHFHSLRHTFASWLAQDGTSLYVIKNLLGHADIKTTQIYSHLQPENLHNEVNRINLGFAYA